jgi:hypothetical protein
MKKYICLCLKLFYAINNFIFIKFLLNISIVEYIYSGRGRGEVKGPTPLSR